MNLEDLIKIKKMLSGVKKYILSTAKKITFELRFVTKYKLCMETYDRKVLEQIILPFFAKSHSTEKILFVGCEWYTKMYELQFKEKEYWTIEPNINKKKYGGKRHLVDPVNNICKYFSNGYFDLIIMNGVIGYGLNDIEEIERSLEKCFSCLRKGGVLLVGWNDLPERKVFELDKSATIKRFKKYVFKPLSCSTYYTKNSTMHIYSFFKK